MKICSGMSSVFTYFERADKSPKIGIEKSSFSRAFCLLACFAATVPSCVSSFVEWIDPCETTIELTRKVGRPRVYVLREASEISPRDIVAVQREEWIQKLKEKAYAFIGTDPSEYREERLAYILHVIDTPRFQGNPRVYILDWIDRRGLTKEYRFVEDAALAFFRLEFDIHSWPNEYDCGM